MPNWVITKVDVNGKDKDKFIAWVEEHKDNLFDSTVPMPKTFKDYDTTNYPYGRRNKNETLKIGEELYTGKVVDEAYINGLIKATKYQKQRYGVVGWYDWACKYWGTKWDASGVCTDENGVSFTTAWAVAEPIVRRWSEMFPNTEFFVSYADEDIGNNCGTFTYSNGELTDHAEETAEFARELWGWEDEEEEDDE